MLTSRTVLLPLRRVLAVRAPDLMGAAGGGAGAILARSDRIVAERSTLLCRRPERRVVHGVALACGVWVSNLQASPSGAEHELRAAVRASWEWARTARLPLILGGDLKLDRPDAEGLRIAASCADGHVLCGAAVGIRSDTVTRLKPGPLSGHVPLAITVVI